MTGQELKLIRGKTLGLSQTDMAGALGQSAVTISRWENGWKGSEIPVDVARQIQCLNEIYERGVTAGKITKGDFQEALRNTGTTGAIAAAALAGLVPASLLKLLGVFPAFGWLSGVFSIGLASSLPFFVKLKQRQPPKQREGIGIATVSSRKRQTERKLSGKKKIKDIPTKNRTSQIVLTFGLSNTFTIDVDHELTVGKLLGFRQVQERLGYDYHNVVALIDGRSVDFETYVGASDTEIDLAVRQNIKAALRPKGLVRKLKRLENLKLKRRGARHDIYITRDGGHIFIPRHARDITTGTLRSIAKEIRPGVGLSDFKRRLSE